jgi:Flp pilus assembly protein TadD
VALDPDQPVPQQNLAAALLLAGDITSARAGFRRTIALLQARGETDQATTLRQRLADLVKLDD